MSWRFPLAVLLAATVVVAIACGDDSTAVSTGSPDGGASEASAADWGPAAVMADPSDATEIAAGTIEVTAECVMLDERGHFRWLVAWPATALVPASTQGVIAVRSNAELLELRDQDRVTLAGLRIEDPDSLEWVAAPDTGCEADGVFHVSTVTEALTPNGDPPLTDGPIGGGLASGTGAQVELTCPEGIDEETTEWAGPATLTHRGAVAEAFGDLVVGWIGEPYEIESTEAWSTWGLNDDAGNLVAVATVVAGNGGWDPSHARYCIIHRPTPPPPPFTLYVSNQSFEDPTVRITITVDGVVVVDQDFDVEGQHNWIAFEPEVVPGEHTLRAISDTGAEFTTELVIPESEPRWAVIDYWFYPDEGPRNFTFHISDEPIGFG